MPEFQLNEPETESHPYYGLDDFAKGYVEAMFFTNGDTADDDEFILNKLGVEALTAQAVKAIAEHCAAFQAKAAHLLSQAYELPDYDEAAAGRDLWFTNQGHGVGFWSRDQLRGGLDDALTALAENDEHYVEIGDDKKIHYR